MTRNIFVDCGYGTGRGTEEFLREQRKKFKVIGFDPVKYPKNRTFYPKESKFSFYPFPVSATGCTLGFCTKPTGAFFYCPEKSAVWVRTVNLTDFLNDHADKNSRIYLRLRVSGLEYDIGSSLIETALVNRLVYLDVLWPKASFPWEAKVRDELEKFTRK